MAGEWLPMRMDLTDDPAVISIAASLGMDEFAVVGRLHRLWSWANRHLSSGVAQSVTEQWIDRYVGAPGFAAAMLAAGWLRSRSAGVEFPNFDRWNSQGAKRRLTKTQWDQANRSDRGHAAASKPTANRRPSDGNPSSDVGFRSSREEKRREEEPPTPSGGVAVADDDPPEGEPTGKPPSPDDVIAVWNATPNLPPFRGTNPHFRRMLADRWRDERFRDRWKDAIAALSRSDWHTGKAGGGGDDSFVATLSWFLGDQGWEKAFAVLERQDAKPKPAPARRAKTIEELNAEDMRMAPPRPSIFAGEHRV